jgi:hypothetical protein
LPYGQGPEAHAQRDGAERGRPRRPSVELQHPELGCGRSMTPQDFIHKWKRANLSERSAYQQHFLDLCELLNQPKPAAEDPEGAADFDTPTDCAHADRRPD